MSKKEENKKKDMLDIYLKFKDSNDFTDVGKLLGKGAFGEVRDIKFRNKTMAGKLIERENSDQQSEEEKVGSNLRGQNIIKINKIYTKEIDGKTYDLIIMEKAVLRDLGKLNEFYHRHNLLKLINNKIYYPFDESMGNNLLRFYSMQIINALEVLDRNDYIHYDIKPENLLITINLIIKLSDFSLITKAIEGQLTKIPGGTLGYVSPEYYIERNVSSEDAKKQDYFALGSTLFFLKFGEHMLKYKKSENRVVNSDKIIELLQQNIAIIKSQKLSDKGFIDFICSLIQYKPKDRPSFENIYRNKWLNKDSDKINTVFSAFENDEEKLIMELQKLDFLIRKEEEFNEEINNNNLNEKKLSFKEKPKKKICRFRFKKKKINNN